MKPITNLFRDSERYFAPSESHGLYTQIFHAMELIHRQAMMQITDDLEWIA